MNDVQNWLRSKGVSDFFTDAFLERKVDGFLLASLGEKELTDYLLIDKRHISKKIPELVQERLKQDLNKEEAWHCRLSNTKEKPSTIYIIFDPKDIAIAFNVQKYFTAKGKNCTEKISAIKFHFCFVGFHFWLVRIVLNRLEMWKDFLKNVVSKKILKDQTEMPTTLPARRHLRVSLEIFSVEQLCFSVQWSLAAEKICAKKDSLRIFEHNFWVKNFDKKLAYVFNSFVVMQVKKEFCPLKMIEWPGKICGLFWWHKSRFSTDHLNVPLIWTQDYYIYLL